MKYIFLGVLFIFFNSSAFSQALDSEITSLKDQVQVLMNRINELEKDQAQILEQKNNNNLASWAEKTSVAGDLRYRFESIDAAESIQRDRQRIRARVGIKSQPSEDLELGFGLTTGGGNPVSGNQTLDGAFTRKTVTIDYAYFDFDINNTLSIRGGKVSNPFFRPGGHHLIFDNDLKPEGFAFKYDSDSFFGNFGLFQIEERSKATDISMFGAQLGYQYQFANEIDFITGISYYNYDGIKNSCPIFFESGAGNTLLPLNPEIGERIPCKFGAMEGGEYANDYREIEFFNELGFNLGAHPITIFFDYVTNTEVDKFDTGYATGFSYRDASAPGTWDMAYTYQDLEADAVLGVFSDSDWAGGSTDGRGHNIRGSYILPRGWNLGLNYFINERGFAVGNKRDYNRLMIDFSFRY